MTDPGGPGKVASTWNSSAGSTGSACRTRRSSGARGPNLGELTAAGLPVPPGFVVTSDAYRHAVEVAGIGAELSRLAGAGSGDDPATLAATAARAQGLVLGMAVPDDVAVAVVDAYHRLGEGGIVAVRSSGTTEDAADTSFAGMNATFTNVCGDDALLQAVRGCWASLYGARVLSYRAGTGQDAEPSLGRGRPGDDPLGTVRRALHRRPVRRG